MRAAPTLGPRHPLIKSCHLISYSAMKAGFHRFNGLISPLECACGWFDPPSRGEVQPLTMSVRCCDQRHIPSSTKDVNRSNAFCKCRFDACSGALPIDSPNASAMEPDGTLGDCKACAKSTRRHASRMVEAVERSKDMFDLTSGDARTAFVHFNKAEIFGIARHFGSRRTTWVFGSV
jgi:hypothetical protein